MKIAIHGLGKMGMQIAKKLSAGGHQVIAHNRSPEPIEEAAAAGATAAFQKQDVLDAFGDDRVIIWLMLPAEVTEQHITEWLGMLPEHSLLIDGGNSDFRNTQRHAELIAAKNIDFLDVGTSGGIMGMEHGFCMMVGGDAASYTRIEPALQTLAAPEGGFQHFGPSGSGHFVKMVHNAIEYGMMESLAEGYRVLHEGPYQNLDLAAAGDIWQKGSVITSTLNRLTAEALHENPTLEGIDGYVAENGEARWTLEVAKAHELPTPSIQAAFDVRVRSQQGETSFTTKLLAAMRNKFGGHALNK